MERFVAYDEALAARVRDVLAGRSGVVEKRMFGGLAFMVDGNMACCVGEDELMVRLPSGETAETVDGPGVSTLRAPPSQARRPGEEPRTPSSAGREAVVKEREPRPTIAARDRR